MSKFIKKRGSALVEYLLIALVCAVAIGITIFQLSPDLLKTYFEKTVNNGAYTNSEGTLTLPAMGE